MPVGLNAFYCAYICEISGIEIGQLMKRKSVVFCVG